MQRLGWPRCWEKFNVSGHEEIAVDTALCIGFAALGGIAVDIKNRVARLVGEDCIIFRDTIVDKLPDFEHHFFVGGGLISQ